MADPVGGVLLCRVVCLCFVVAIVLGLWYRFWVVLLGVSCRLLVGCACLGVIVGCYS